MTTRPGIRLRVRDPYQMVRECVENGAAYAWRSRIWKHTDQPHPNYPDDETAIETIVDCVMGEVCEMFELETDDTD